jgi:anaerobic selenocysteine-containing dehydrogenase
MRLKYPLKRAGKRGEDKWTRISWDEALDEIAGRLSELKSSYGAETLALTAGDAWLNPDEYKARFLNLFGSPNIIGPSPICMGPRGLVCDAILGWSPQFSVRPTTKCVVSLGSTMDITRPGVWQTFLKAQKNGAKLIVVDPRRTAAAAKANLWLQLRPGTDAALLLGMINHIIQADLFDRPFVEKWCHGFEAMAERAKEYNLDKVANITRVPAERIREAAVMYASHNPATIVEGMGVEQQTNSVQVIHARCVLAGLTGNLDIEGGEELPGPHSAVGLTTDRQIELLEVLSEEQRRKQIAYDRFKLHSLPGQELLQKYIGTKAGERGGVHWYKGQAHLPSVYRTIISGKPYPIRALISSASNPLVSHPNTIMVHRALKATDLFVMLDLVMNPTAQLADYVLPVASWLEKPLLYSGHGLQDGLYGCQAAVPYCTDQYDRRNDFDFWRGLGVRLGQKSQWPWRTIEESYAERMADMELSFDELCEVGWIRDIGPNYKKYEKQGFNTSTGKVEFYSTIFEELGYDPLPYYQAPPVSSERTPELAKQYPLILINGGRSMEFVHSLWREIPVVRQKHPDPLIQMHTDTAVHLGISEGDWVWVETPLGRVRLRCAYFDGLNPEVVHADSQWWYPELPGKEPFLYGLWLSNINTVIDDDPEVCNEIIGSWPQRHTLCRIYK